MLGLYSFHFASFTLLFIYLFVCFLVVFIFFDVCWCVYVGGCSVWFISSMIYYIFVFFPPFYPLRSLKSIHDTIIVGHCVHTVTKDNSVVKYIVKQKQTIPTSDKYSYMCQMLFIFPSSPVSAHISYHLLPRSTRSSRSKAASIHSHHSFLLPSSLI